MADLSEFFKLIAEDKKKKQEEFNSIIGELNINSIFSVLPTSVDGDLFEVCLILNPTLTGAAFTSTPDSSFIQFDVTATALSGGRLLYNSYTVGADRTGGANPQSINIGDEYNWNIQLGRTQSKVSDIITLAARVLTGDGTILGSMGVYELS